jgi:hypothetical protein
MQQGEISSVVMYLINGSVSVVHDGEKRASIQAPAMIGHHSFIYRRARTAAIICESQVVYFQVALDELLASVAVLETNKASTASYFPSVAETKSSLITAVTIDPVDPAHVSSSSPRSPPTRHHQSTSSNSTANHNPLSGVDDVHVRMIDDAAAEKSFVSHHVSSESVAQLNTRYFDAEAHPFNGGTVRSPPSAPSSSISGIGRDLAGMSVSDSLGMMMRQHHVVLLFCHFTEPSST